ncbi:hypothetical protein BDV25DRAFT_144475 [Aspergillus avenaceus]|uniref:Uncharacterized protein n=1 Tax=Aspergillus avenaceus TaxID=36643 RepID=A0A5N6TH35_ASPAV|nr:hypothetical protein BDV25DRAFT_144475 [Aspergillus avenaceus]
MRYNLLICTLLASTAVARTAGASTSENTPRQQPDDECKCDSGCTSKGGYCEPGITMENDANQCACLGIDCTGQCSDLSSKVFCIADYDGTCMSWDDGPDDCSAGCPAACAKGGLSCGIKNGICQCLVPGDVCEGCGVENGFPCLPGTSCYDNVCC